MMRSWLAFGFAFVAILEVLVAVGAAAQPAARAPTIVVYKGPT
jgi:hypothetical protein